MRKLIHILTSILFLFSQTLTAAPLRDIELTRSFLKDTGIAQGPTSLKEVYNKVRSDLPADLQAEFEALFAQTDIELPKINVQKIVNEKGEEEVQLQGTANKATFILTIKNRGPLFATFAGTENGKSVKFDILHSDISKGLKLYDEKILGRTLASTNEPSSPIMSYEDYTKLNPKDRAEYAREVQKILMQLEKLQNEIHPAKKSSQYDFLFNIIIEQAWAQVTDGTACVAAGNMTQYKDGYCGRGSGLIIQGSSVVCNPTFFGDDPPITVPLKSSIPIVLHPDTTAQCFNQHPSTPDPQRYVKNVNSKADFDKWNDDFKKQKMAAEAHCGIVLGSGNKVKKDQPATCEALNKQLARLNFMCSQLEQSGKYAGIKCSGAAQPQPGPPVQPVPPIAAPTDPLCQQLEGKVAKCTGDEKKTIQCGGGKTVSYCECKAEKDPVQDGMFVLDCKPKVTNVEACEKLKGKKLSCNSEGQKTLDCPNNSTVSYCICEKGEAGYADTRPYPTACYTKGGDKAKTGSSSSSRKTSSSASSFKVPTWLLLLGGMGAGLFLHYYQQKRSVENYYKMWNSSPVATPVPPPYYPTPTTVDRPAPATR